MTPEIEEFARALVLLVRDESIQSNDMALLPDAHFPVADRWARAASGPPSDFARVMIPDIVDNAIFYLLHAIDNGELRISFTASNGKVVDLCEDGELAGWFIGSEGWREQYSKERFVDDFADLRLKDLPDDSAD